MDPRTTRSARRTACLQWRSSKARWKRLRDRLRRTTDLRAARKRRRHRLRAWSPLDDRIYVELTQARAELEFTYRNNLDLR